MQQVVVQLFNGLGNQLFQYAAGRWLASMLGASLRLVHHDAQAGTPAPGQSPRPLLMQRFAIRRAIEPMSRLDRLVVSVRPQFRLPGRIARGAGRIQLLYQDPKDVSHPFEFEVDAGARGIYLCGYFQEYALVSEIAGLLRRELSLAGPLQDRAQDYAERIGAARHPVSIHLRRGDYLTTFGHEGVLPMSYYERAIENIQEQFRDASFFVFSDDLAFARFWARSHPRMTVVDCSDDAHAHECMHLMSLCHHHVIANSTFSWWGAWLNRRPDKQVIAPDRWLGVATSNRALACPDWQQLTAFGPAGHTTHEQRIARSA